MREMSGETNTGDVGGTLASLLLLDSPPEWLRPLTDTYRGDGGLEFMAQAVKATVQQMVQDIQLAELDGTTDD